MHQLESLDAFRLARSVSRDAYRLTLKRDLRPHFALSDQIRRAATSIPANICEGYSLGTRRQLIRCLRIALGSSSELKCHLELARDLGLVVEQESTQVLRSVDRLLSVLVGLLKRLGATVPS